MHQWYLTVRASGSTHLLALLWRSAVRQAGRRRSGQACGGAVRFQRRPQRPCRLWQPGSCAARQPQRPAPNITEVTLELLTWQTCLLGRGVFGKAAQVTLSLCRRRAGRCAGARALPQDVQKSSGSFAWHACLLGRGMQPSTGGFIGHAALWWPWSWALQRPCRAALERQYCRPACESLASMLSLADPKPSQTIKPLASHVHLQRTHMHLHV